jgi:hypothetical protein
VDPKTAVLGVAVPAVLAGTIRLALKKPWAGALALALAAFAGSLIVLGFSFPPREPQHWFGLLGLATGLGALSRPRAIGWLAWCVLSAAGALAVLGYVPVERLSRGGAVGWGVAYSVGSLAVGLGLERLAARRERLALPIALWVVAAGGAVAVALAGFIGAGQVAGAVAAGLGALVFFSWWRPLDGRVHAATPAVAFLLPAIWLDGYWMADLTPAAGLLLGAAPLGGWAAELPLLKERPKLAAAACILGVAAPTAIAVVLSIPAPSDY